MVRGVKYSRVIVTETEIEVQVFAGLPRVRPTNSEGVLEDLTLRIAFNDRGVIAATTYAPGTAAPVESVTEPTIPPRKFCATASEPCGPNARTEKTMDRHDLPP